MFEPISSVRPVHVCQLRALGRHFLHQSGSLSIELTSAKALNRLWVWQCELVCVCVCVPSWRGTSLFINLFVDWGFFYDEIDYWQTCWFLIFLRFAIGLYAVFFLFYVVVPCLSDYFRMLVIFTILFSKESGISLCGACIPFSSIWIVNCAHIAQAYTSLLRLCFVIESIGIYTTCK